LSISEILRGPSLNELAEEIVSQIVRDPARTTVPANAPILDVDTLSDDQVDALLAELKED
jgi:hypothetical protein